MRIVFVASAARDVAWFRHSYKAVFPEGDRKARAQLKHTLSLISANPYLGHPSEVGRGVRELHLRRTPFTLIYRVTEVRIEILRLWDERQGGSLTGRVPQLPL